MYIDCCDLECGLRAMGCAWDVHGMWASVGNGVGVMRFCHSDAHAASVGFGFFSFCYDFFLAAVQQMGFVFIKDVKLLYDVVASRVLRYY